MNTATMTNASMPYRPEPTPPNTTSPICISAIGTSPPSGVNESCIEFTEPFDAAVVAVAHSAEPTGPKRTSLPSMFPPACVAEGALVDAELGQQRVAALLAGDVEDGEGHQDHDHRGEDRPPLAAVAHHLAERQAQGARDQQDRDHLEEVRKRRRVLERVRRVDVEEPAAVRAELLDRDLRRGRTERQRLLGHRDLLGDRVALRVLDRGARGVELRLVHHHRLDERHLLVRRQKVCTTPCDTSASARISESGSRM